MKEQFDPIFSLHVYSVQAVVPKDSAQLWAVDNEQIKELFPQPDNPIASNRLSAIDFPEAQTRSIQQPTPVASEPAVKKEQMKAQLKEEDGFSQPSSPEKEKTVAHTKSGRLTTPVKKGSSPTKKQSANTREMTTFFKKAPEDAKMQTLFGNAKGKGNGSSPTKKKVMESFFAKKERGEDKKEGEEKMFKVKKENPEGADLNEDVIDEMDFENKEDTKKRLRLRKGGKRKRGDDSENETVATEANEANHAEEAVGQLSESDGRKKKRRIKVNGQEEEPTDNPTKESKTTKPAKAKKSSPSTVKKARKTATNRADGRTSEEEDNGEKENEDYNGANTQKVTKKAPQKEVIERKEGAAKPLIQTHNMRRKKRVRRERTYVDDKGYEVTEDVWEEVSDEDTPAPPLNLASIKEEAANENGGAGASSAIKKRSTAQANIMAFFGKK